MSDSNMPSLSGLVVGTAGHIDHGKTSLVYALTGIDTDRLKEEKRRGISIDVGFAQMLMPDGCTISFVDVPGHERFVRNMLAGAAGMEAVMLIIAANESVMPQTREHFEICRLLGLQHGIVVLTKCDLASKEQIARAHRAVAELTAISFLADAPVVEVSAVSMTGLPELKRLLSEIAAKESSRDRDGVVRMPIDRSFAVKGFGTVVTGTLQGGVISVGETFELRPQNKKVRVRSLQAQHVTVQQARAGQRVAVNLAGVDHRTIKRGHVLVSPDALSGSRVIDVELHWLDAKSLPSARELFVLHLGTAETGILISTHGRRGEVPQFARFRSAEEVLAVPGDRFVIRRPSPAQTVGGGVVIDAFPPRRTNKAKTVARLEALSSTKNLGNRVELLLNESVTGRSMPDLIRMTGSSHAKLRVEMAGNGRIAISNGDRAVTRQWIEEKQKAVIEFLKEFHKLNPTSAGASLAAARLNLETGLAALVLENFPSIRVQGETVALASHQASFSTQEEEALTKMEDVFRGAGFQPPPIPDVLSASGLDAKKARTLLEALVKRQRLIRLQDELLFHADIISHIRTSLAGQKGRRFSVVEFKDWTKASRKFAIPLLEYLDRQRVTKRDGEVRIVL